jgi:Lrp/AsnC family transcriptional regulator for asnA, asnC and gidA
MRIDALDQALIGALETDGRRPYREIARELGVSEATVRGRVGKLTESGFIRITAVGNPLRLGFDVMAIVLVKIQPGQAQEVAKRLTEFKNVRFVGMSFGSADIIIQTLHPTVQDLLEFVSKTMPLAAPGIKSTETFQLAEVLKSSWDWQAWFAAQAVAEEEEEEE